MWILNCGWNCDWNGWDCDLELLISDIDWLCGLGIVWWLIVENFWILMGYVGFVAVELLFGIL